MPHSPSTLPSLPRVTGSGEFAQVYRGLWQGSIVAVKVLKESNVDIGALRTEVAVMRRLRHPNMVQILGANTTTKPYFIIAELMSCSLERALSSLYSLPRRRALEICVDIASGLAYLHSLQPPIIHRDLKPANIMIGGS